MAASAEQIPRPGWEKRTFPGPYSYEKRMQHRKQRRLMKRDPEYAPTYNRYDGWSS